MSGRNLAFLIGGCLLMVGVFVVAFGKRPRVLVAGLFVGAIGAAVMLITSIVPE